MKRLCLCSVILAVILAAAVGWAAFLGRSSRRLSTLIDSAQSLAEERSPGTQQAIEELCGYWESFASVAALFESSDSLSSIGDSAAKLSYLYNKDNDEFYSECEVIRCGVDRIYRSNVPFMPNK